MGDATVAHERSEFKTNPSLSLFKVPETEISFNGYRMVPINPTTTGITPMEFVFPALEHDVDLNRSFFQMKLRLKYVDGANLVVADNHIVNTLAHSPINYVSMRLNGV